MLVSLNADFVMFSGESGLGKSTLVNSLFLTDLHKDRKLLNAEGESAVSLNTPPPPAADPMKGCRSALCF